MFCFLNLLELFLHAIGYSLPVCLPYQRFYFKKDTLEAVHYFYFMFFQTLFIDVEMCLRRE